MAHYTLSEEAETALYHADHALALVQTLASHAGDTQVEVTGEELACFMALVRQQVHGARGGMQFVTIRLAEKAA